MLQPCMASLQVKNVPEPLHRRIRAHASRQGKTVGEVVLDAVRRQLDDEEFRKRLANRARVNLGRPAARTLAATRKQRDRELGG